MCETRCREWSHAVPCRIQRPGKSRHLSLSDDDRLGLGGDATLILPIDRDPRMHSTLLTNHLLSSSWTLVASRKAPCLYPPVMTLALFGRGKKSTRSTTPSSWMYRVCRMHEEGRYCCFVVHPSSSGGAMLKYPPWSLSRSRQKIDGESKVGLWHLLRTSAHLPCPWDKALFW